MSVLADWLVGRGDPRGELMQLQLQLELAPEEPRLVRAAAALGRLPRAEQLREVTDRKSVV